MDADRCEGRAGTVGQCGAERVLDPTAGETRGPAPAQRGTRRWLVRLVASLSLGGVLAVVGAEARAAERPHERLGQRTPQRNRRQRNDNDNDNDNNNKKNDTNNNNPNDNTTNTTDGGGSGGQLGAGVPSQSDPRADCLNQCFVAYAQCQTFCGRDRDCAAACARQQSSCQALCG